jgi:taurine dioxygenase
MELRIEPASAALGAWVRDIDMAAEQAPAVRAALAEALHRYGVLFLEPTDPIDRDAFVRFGACFGELLVYPYSHDPGHPEVTSIDSERVPPVAYRTNQWHTDGSPEECPPQAALMRAVTLPATGGDTMWASMYAAWEALSDRYQRFLDGLEAEHSTAAALRHYDSSQANVFGEGARTLHPVAPRDPVTGRRMLYVNANYTERICGLTATESDSVLQMLLQHVNTPEFHIRLQWRPNTVAVWEERVTQHRAVADYDGLRRLDRITIRGDRPRI